MDGNHSKKIWVSRTRPRESPGLELNMDLVSGGVTRRGWASAPEGMLWWLLMLELRKGISATILAPPPPVLFSRKSPKLIKEGTFLSFLYYITPPLSTKFTSTATNLTDWFYFILNNASFFGFWLKIMNWVFLKAVLLSRTGTENIVLRKQGKGKEK